LFGGFISEGGHRSFSLLDVPQITRNQPLSTNFCMARTPSPAASSSFYPLPKNAVILSEGGLPPAFSRAGNPSRRILVFVIQQSLKIPLERPVAPACPHQPLSFGGAGLQPCHQPQKKTAALAPAAPRNRPGRNPPGPSPAPLWPASTP